MRLLIFIPCFNESKTIKDVISSFPDYLDGVSIIDVLVVDDGSVDETQKEALNCGAKVIRHKKNLGLGEAFKTGVDYAILNKYDIMVNIDGDGQFNPSEIADLIHPILAEKADMVTGSRFIANKNKIPNMPLVKQYGNFIMSKFISFLVNKKYYDVSCGFRAYSFDTLCKLNLQGTFTYTQESFIQLIASKITIMEIPITVKYFQERKSRMASSVINYAFNALIIIFNVYKNYYTFKLFSIISFISFLIASIFGSISIIHFIETSSFSGYYFAILISAVSGLFSIFSLLLGIAFDQVAALRHSVDSISYRLKKMQ